MPARRRRPGRHPDRSRRVLPRFRAAHRPHRGADHAPASRSRRPGAAGKGPGRQPGRPVVRRPGHRRRAGGQGHRRHRGRHRRRARRRHHRRTDRRRPRDHLRAPAGYHQRLLPDRRAPVPPRRLLHRSWPAGGHPGRAGLRAVDGRQGGHRLLPGRGTLGGDPHPRKGAGQPGHGLRPARPARPGGRPLARPGRRATAGPVSPSRPLDKAGIRCVAGGGSRMTDADQDDHGSPTTTEAARPSGRGPWRLRRKPDDSPERPDPRVVRRLVLGSALMLFLELALIRWLGANVVHLSYFSNFVLLGSFLGIGLGFLIARHRWSVLPAAPIILAALVILVFLEPVTIDRAGDDVIYFTSLHTSGPPAWAVLPVIFVLVAACLAGPAEAVGRCFPHLRPLTAYRWDLVGSLIGILSFTAMSFLRAPSVVWGIVVTIGFVLLIDGWKRWLSAACG